MGKLCIKEGLLNYFKSLWCAQGCARGNADWINQLVPELVTTVDNEMLTRGAMRCCW